MLTSLRCAPRHFLNRVGAPAHWVRANSTIANTVSYRVMYHDGAATALHSPSENVKLSYVELDVKILEVAGGLTKLGYGKGDVMVTDIHHGASGALLQLAASHIGGVVVTVKNAAEVDALSNDIYMKGAVMSGTSSFLSKLNFDTKSIIGEVKGKGAEGVTDRDNLLAHYGSSKGVSNRVIYLNGVGLAGLLEIKPADVVCVAAPLSSQFGMGGCIAAFVRNATCYLPDISKVDMADATILLAEEAQLEQLRKVKGAKIRGGAVQSACNGTDVLLDKYSVDFAGTPLRKISTGTKDDAMSSLYDASKDTYYSFK